MHIHWGRLAIVWAGIVAVIVGCSMLLGCSAVYAYEDAHSLPVPVLTVLAEAGGEGMEGMVAVSNVIRNRAKRRGLTVEQVCLQRKQFSCWNDGGVTVYRYAERNRAIWDDALTAWQVSGTEDLTGGADHYFADYIKRPKWALGMDFKGRVGKHLFYRS